MKLVVQLGDWIYACLKSKWFFWGILSFFAINAIWLAFSALYPMPFDEYYHIGIIQAYADQWSPFITTQTPDQSYLGDITRSTSYFYHYLMSFPFRFIEWIGGDFTVQLLALRTISVGLAVLSLIQFRKLLLESGFSKQLTSVTLLVFSLIPIISFIAAHVNYDNLLLLITVVALRLSSKIILKPQKSLNLLGWLAVLTFIGCIVKETFIPLIGLMIVAVLVRLITFHKAKITRWFKNSLRSIKKAQLTALTLCLLIFGGLFLESYGGNLVQYGTITPKCEAVQSEESCRRYSPWLRNYRNLETRDQKADWLNVADYGELWLKRVMRGEFVIFSHFPQFPTEEEPFGPILGGKVMPAIQWLGWILLITGISASIYWWRLLWGQLSLRILVVVSVGYVLAVLVFNYQSYLSLGAPQAIQARYFYPVLPILIALFLQSLNYTLKFTKLKLIALAMALFFALHGGGAISYIIYTDETWYLPSSIMTEPNEVVRNILKPVIIK